MVPVAAVEPVPAVVQAEEMVSDLVQEPVPVRESEWALAQAREQVVERVLVLGSVAVQAGECYQLSVPGYREETEKE